MLVNKPMTNQWTLFYLSVIRLIGPFIFGDDKVYVQNCDPNYVITNCNKLNMFDGWNWAQNNVF